MPKLDEMSDSVVLMRALKLEGETTQEFVAEYRKLTDADKDELIPLARQHLASLDS